MGLPWAQRFTSSGPRGEADVDANAYESIKGTLTIKQTKGREPVRNDEVAVGRALMDQIGARIGDRITAQGIHGDVELTIVGDNLDPGVDVAGHGFAMTVNGLSALGDASVQGTVIRFARGTDHAALIKRYSALGFAPVTPPSEVGHIGQLGGLPGRVGQLLTLLGIAALLNAMVLTVRSGRREIALHRAFGFTSAQVVRVHLWQSIVTAFTGVVIGGSVGFIVGRAINRQLVGNVGDRRNRARGVGVCVPRRRRPRRSIDRTGTSRVPRAARPVQVLVGDHRGSSCGCASVRWTIPARSPCATVQASSFVPNERGEDAEGWCHGGVCSVALAQGLACPMGFLPCCACAFRL